MWMHGCMDTATWAELGLIAPPEVPGMAVAGSVLQTSSAVFVP